MIPNRLHISSMSIREVWWKMDKDFQNNDAGASVDDSKGLATTLGEWLDGSVDAIRAIFTAHGFEIPEQVKVSIGHLRQGVKGRARSEAWPPEASAGRVAVINVRPEIADAHEFLCVTLMAMIWLVAPPGCGLGPEYRVIAEKLGLSGRMRTPVISPELWATIAGIACDLGPFPHFSLNTQYFSVKPSKQNGFLTISCPVAGCTYSLTGAPSTLLQGLPDCPVHHHSMVEETGRLLVAAEETGQLLVTAAPNDGHPQDAEPDAGTDHGHAPASQPVDKPVDPTLACLERDGVVAVEQGDPIEAEAGVVADDPLQDMSAAPTPAEVSPDTDAPSDSVPSEQPVGSSWASAPVQRRRRAASMPPKAREEGATSPPTAKPAAEDDPQPGLF